MSRQSNQETLGNGCICSSGCESCDRLAEAFEAMREVLREIAAWEPDRAPDEPNGMSIIDAIDTSRAALALADEAANGKR